MQSCGWASEPSPPAPLRLTGHIFNNTMHFRTIYLDHTSLSPQPSGTAQPKADSFTDIQAVSETPSDTPEAPVFSVYH